MTHARLAAAGTDRTRIVDVASRLLSCQSRGATIRERPNPFGDGHAAERIVIAIERFLRGETTLLSDDEQLAPARVLAAV
jgi:UDP-N-acetylglucosamine 2-epimerase (non-hydrolysing)